MFPEVMSKSEPLFAVNDRLNNFCLVFLCPREGKAELTRKQDPSWFYVASVSCSAYSRVMMPESINSSSSAMKTLLLQI